MGPLWRGVVLVPPHAKGALGITAVPNRGRSLLPEARQGLISLKAMRRDSPPQELGAKFSWESEWLSQAGGQLQAGVPHGHRGTRLGLYLGSALTSRGARAPRHHVSPWGPGCPSKDRVS